ncbi:MAG: hypothetical protein JXA15_12830, partial [Spirochaetales bacterium]|nr:hypothetical protein [Spirochaetales bacterium]
MRAWRSIVFVSAALILFTGTALAQDAKPESELLGKIRALPGVVETQTTRFDDKLFREAYEVMFEQPLD